MDPSQTKPKIGFLGCGNMGAPMCIRLVQAGYQVTAYDISEKALQNVVGHGAIAAKSAADCASGSDIFLTSLPRPDHVEAVMLGSDGALASLKSGAIWIDLTTNRKDLVEKIAASAPRGVKIVDCPVTGAVDGARNGKLTLFIGGELDVVTQVKPILSHLGLVIHCGPRGTGNVVKLVTNQLWFIAAAAIGEGFAIGIGNGVELGTLWHAIKESVGDSFVARHDAPSIFAGHYDPSFSLDLCMKDLNLINELSANISASLPMTDAARDAFALATERYGAKAAELHVAKRIEDDAKISMRLAGDWTPPWDQ